MNVPSREGGPSPEELFFGKQEASPQLKVRTPESVRAGLGDAAADRARARVAEMRAEAKGAAVLDPEFVKSSIEREIDATENAMSKLKRGSDEWNELAGKNNELDLELSAVDRVMAEKQEEEATEVEVEEHDEEGEAPALAMPESEMLTKQKAFEARQEAFARAKVKAEEMRASYAKPAPAKQPGFFSRVASWWRGATPAQSEAQQKIAQELTPALREQRAPEVQAQQEQARKNAAAYEAQVLSRSRVAKAAEAGSEKEDVAQAAK